MVPIDAFEIFDFPKLTIDEIRKHVTFGTYQINQSYGYLAEHFKINGKYTILIEKENQQVNGDKLICVEIQSRHSNAVKYKLYIRYPPNNETERTDISLVERLTSSCTCNSGLRTCIWLL